jgi:hypothetical protein
MRIPEKYIHQSGKNKGKLNQKLLKVEGKFKRGDAHPKVKGLLWFSKATKWMLEQDFLTKQEKITSYNHNWKRENRGRVKEYNKQYREENNHWILPQQREYKVLNKEKCDAKRHEWWLKNRHIKNQKNRIFMNEYSKTPEGKEARKKYRESKKSDTEFMLRKNLAGCIREAIKKQASDKAYKSMELLGCTIEHVRDHLESQFTAGMTWDNMGRGGWHIDHIIPCAFFDLTKPSHQKVCFNYQNLQPMWESENCSKKDKIPWYVLLTILMNNYKTITL